MSISPNQISLILYTETDTLTGITSVPRGARVSDILNDRFSNDYSSSGAFLHLNTVTMFNEEGIRERYSSLYIAKSTLHMIETPDSDMSRGIGNKAGRKRRLYIQKSPVNVRVQLPKYTLRGNIHCTDGETFTDVLNAELMFLPLTDVKIQSKGTDRWRAASFLAINRKEIFSVHDIIAS